MAHPQVYLRLQPPLNQKFGAIDHAEPQYLKQLLAQTNSYLATQRTAIEAFLSN